MVFYNYILKCFVIIDLKRGKLTHQDVGQMDMYVRMFDDLEKSEEDFKLDENEIYKLITGGYKKDEDLHKRPLSKLIKDISEELKLI